MTHSEEYKQRVHSLQKSILTLQLFIMVFGIGIFTLGVISRPILRITSPEFAPTVKWIVNVMVGAGLAQFVAASYDIFSGCWKLMWPIYLGIAGTTLTTFLELAAIGSTLYLYTRSFMMVNEQVIHPWYWVECLNMSSCHSRMLNYIHWFILPQVVLAAATVILQCVTIIYQGKLVKSIVDHHRVLHEAQERYHEKWEEEQFNFLQKKSTQQPGTSKDDEICSMDSNQEDDHENLGTPPSRRVQFSDTEMSPLGSARKRRGESMEMVHKRTYEAQIHLNISTPVTPRSILKGDHGYVAGSRVSLDMDKP